jgi:lipid II isoglutaminyl synthase (glutamine-hydrolysing)
MAARRELNLGHLYPALMNVYGDRGNIICLQRRCRLRDIDLNVTPLKLGEILDPSAFDILFMGGAQDREQRLVAEDLLTVKGAPLREAVEDGVVFLAVCGGYQLAGHYYRESDGTELRGAGVFDLYTEHPGPSAKRLIGNLVAEWEGGRLVGFENHGGRTRLGAKVEPLGRVVRGYGNDGVSGFEGARFKNAFGTYLHGPVLPKNAALADRLISLALARKHGDDSLSPIDDAIEERAHAAAVRIASRG